MHLIGWFASQDNAVLTAIAALADTSMTREGSDGYQVPAQLPQLWAGAALGESLTRARYIAPSLEGKRYTADIWPIADSDDAFSLTHPQIWRPMRAIDLQAGEVLQAHCAEDGAGATANYVFAWLKASGDLPAAPAGDIIQARATGAVTLVANTWTAVSPTLEQELPAGRYACVGLIALGASMIAARLVIPGQFNRPGTPALIGAESVALNFNSKNLEMFQGYNWGEFTNTALPQVECIASAADTTQTFYFLLVKVA